jgi:hypothetical protein
MGSLPRGDSGWKLALRSAATVTLLILPGLLLGVLAQQALLVAAAP